MAHKDLVKAVVPQLETARAELVAELQAVESALAALRNVTRESQSQRVVLASPQPTIKALVLTVLQGQEGPWTAKQVEAVIADLPEAPPVSNIGNAVRTALGSLEKDGAAVRVQRGQYAASTWAEPATTPDEGGEAVT